MTDPPRYPDRDLAAGNETGLRPDRESTTGMPRWVKVSAIVALIVVLLFLVVMLTGGGAGHGPSRHSMSGGVNDPTFSLSLTESGVQQS
ncbi:MAG: hypothetical protein M3381_13585 [Actinomycetota bacterium]|nr:hypothetical protein [Actinomycetota bacterium]